MANVPAAQATHTLADGTEAVPGGQGRHRLDPGIEKSPAAQGWQAPPSNDAVPPAHGAQTFCPCIGAEVPGMQAVQLVEPTRFVAVPIAHGVQSGLWGVEEKVPT